MPNNGDRLFEAYDAHGRLCSSIFRNGQCDAGPPRGLSREAVMACAGTRGASGAQPYRTSLHASA